MQNIIVVGDSFCSSPNHWPKKLANKMNLDLICHGLGGQSWWNVREFLSKLDDTILENTSVMVFAHTNADRLPTSNEMVGYLNHSDPEDSELGQAIRLYYKHIHSREFLTWAQQQWFQEISARWGEKKLIHLHSFPWSLSHAHLLKGVNVSTNLMAISLNELGSSTSNAVNDMRPNHFNEHNNSELADQIAGLLINYHEGTVELDISRFDQKIDDWLTKTEWN